MPNFARSRGRSRRLHSISTRNTLLVPVLLAALAAPLLPAGTALAATPPPATSSASATPEAVRDESTSAAPQAVQDEPTPEPTAPATTAPTPEPTTDPSPEPTAPEPTPTATDPAAGPCPVLPLAPLGDPGDAVREVSIEANGTACFTVTVETAGTHRILIDGSHDTYPGLYAGEERVACEDWQYKDAWCDLAAGSYTLRLTSNSWQPATNRIAVVPLTAGVTGPCPAVPGTGYDTPLVNGTGVGPMGVVCHSFTAAPGERITVDLKRQTYGDSYAWISDATGKRLCTQYNQDGSEGCVLPGGSTGHRVYAVVGPQEGGATAAPYTLKVRRLSDPAGCVTVAPSVYGTPPDRTGPASGCKTFTPTTTGRHDVRSVSAEGYRQNVTVYAQDGTHACRSYDDLCTLTAGTAYTVLTDDAVQFFTRTATEGCVDGVVPGTVLRGTFSGPGEADCLNLALPQGAHVAVQSDGTTDIKVYDAAGAEQCLNATNLWDATCVLGGTAPYRAVVTDEDPYEGGDGYGIVVHRTDAPSDCPVFGASDFGPNPARTAVRTGDGVFAGCLTIPATAHSARELFQITKGAGGLSAEAVVVDAKGEVSCEIRTYYGTFSTCTLTPGLAHTVLVQGRDLPGETLLTRHDVTATARGCVTTAAVAAGGPSTGGVPGAPGTFQCRRVTTSAAGDTLHLNVRDSADAVRAIAYDGEGDAVCDYFAKGCAVTGSAAYQVLLQVPAGGTAPAAYRLDAVRIGTPAGPAPECAKVPNVAYGTGPLTGTLSEQHSALCWALPTAEGDRFDLPFTPAGSFETMPTPRLYDRTSRVNLCYGSYSSAGETYNCSLSGSGSVKTAKPTTLVIGLPEKPATASTAVKAQLSCTAVVCGTDARSVGTVGPATVGRGKITMTVTGSALHSSAKVVVRSGTFRAESTTLSVAADRRSMTVALDLTNAPLGSLSTSVYAFGVQYQKPDVTVVAALRNTAAASVSGTAVVGGKVTAKPGTWSLPVDSLTYQWRANGTAIAGATASTYTIPTALQGKSLSVAVVARKAGHPTLTSVSGSVVVKGVAPKATRVPAISGTVRVGTKVTAAVGTWSPAATSYAYQWKANSVAISGATGSAYTPAAAVRGKKLTVTVTAHRTGHLSGSATSAGITVATGLAPKATTLPSLSGTVRVGRTLTLNRGVWTPAPTSYAYQWYANGRAISGATRTTFVITKAQRGQRITVKVTAVRTGHATGYAWTRATGAVAG
ncbi:hypothetical protein ACFFSH_16375 [Streptomyces filamentosus]|uniref:Tat pathway signal protein n=1 Tax=Streptomyces filamentosus TaxID=67294 RepID=A0A919BGF5_STRFL|nr:hypothetical protein [Streptomyces filamentosus]GHF90232.1 hypothetical protein GCM10017667_19140 [Streptomyces filamentosus]